MKTKTQSLSDENVILKEKLRKINEISGGI